MFTHTHTQTQGEDIFAGYEAAGAPQKKAKQGGGFNLAKQSKAPPAAESEGGKSALDFDM